MADSIKATPRNRALGVLADSMGSVSRFAQAPLGRPSPVMEVLSDLVGLPGAHRALDDASYGGSPFTGRGQTLQLKDDYLALGSLASGPVSGVAKKAPKVAAAGYANLTAPTTMSRAGQRGVIKLGAGDSSAIQSTEKVFGNTAVDGMTKSTKLYPDSGHSVVFASNKGLIPTQPTLKQAGLDRYASGTGQMGSAPLEVLSVNADGPLRYVILDGHHRGAVNILKDPNGFQAVKIVGEYTPKGTK